MAVNEENMLMNLRRQLSLIQNIDASFVPVLFLFYFIIVIIFFSKSAQQRRLH